MKLENVLVPVKCQPASCSPLHSSRHILLARFEELSERVIAHQLQLFNDQVASSCAVVQSCREFVSKLVPTQAP